MHPYRKAQLVAPVRVLVVEHEPVELTRTCVRVLAEGCELSTSRVVGGLKERIMEAKPDIVVVDVLMPNLEISELCRLASAAGSERPAIVIHTRVLRPLLRRVLDLTKILGIITKTENDAEFSRMFREMTRALRSRSSASDAQGAGASGTRVIGGDEAADQNDYRALRQG